MSERKIIGWQPIHEPQPGSITTQACIRCDRCGSIFSSHGGPRMGALCAECIRPAVTRPDDELLAALAVASQALMEVYHAQSVGPDWYTRGASGLRTHVTDWVNRGRKAVDAALKVKGAD